MTNLPQLKLSEVTIRRKSIKHLYFRICDDGDVVISAPKRMPMSAIEQAFEEKRLWIQKTQEKVRKRAEISQVYRNEDEMLTQWQLWGQSYQVIQYEDKKNSLVINEANLTVEIAFCPTMTVAKQNQWLIEDYRRRLMPVVNQYVQYYQPIIGVATREVRSKNMKTKWGTCNGKDKRLWINVQLAKYPKKCCEYVVVHELVHLLERYHNARFYQLVEQAMPDWEKWHYYLKQQ